MHGSQQLDSNALDVADAKADAHERVEVDSPRQYVPAALGRAESTPVSATPASSASAAISVSARPRRRLVIEVAVSHEAAPGDSADTLDRLRQLPLAADEDPLDSPALHHTSLTSGAMSAAARRLDPDDVACPQSRVTFAGSSSPFRRLRPGAPSRAAGGAARPVPPALREEGEPAVLEHAQLADDAVAAAVPPGAARAEPQRQRSTRSGYASSSASTGVMSVFDIATWTPDGPSASGHAPWPPPIVS